MNDGWSMKQIKGYLWGVMGVISVNDGVCGVKDRVCGGILWGL